MATTTSAAPSTRVDGRPKDFWTYLALGLALAIAGAFALGDTAVASLISAKFLGGCAVFVGSFTAMHAFLTKGWIGFAWRIALGALYFTIGIVLMLNPASNQQILTWLFALLLAATGFVRIYVGFANFSKLALPLLLSGIFGLVAAAIIASGWPIAGLWAMGLLIGLDLLFHGFAWIAFAWLPDAWTPGRAVKGWFGMVPEANRLRTAKGPSVQDPLKPEKGPDV